LQYKHVVTSFLQASYRILLLRRSSKVRTYQGRWASVSGYLEGNEEPLQRARIEIQEEVGLNSESISLVRTGEVLRAFDEAADTVWVIHPFLFNVQGEAIRLDWEHAEYRWVDPSELVSYDVVPKLNETFERVRWDLTDFPASLSKVLADVSDVARDRIHGASFLGQRAVEVLKDTVRSSTATFVDELFRDVLLVTLRLRKAQPGMATIHNLTGRMLQEIDQKRHQPGSLEDLRTQIILLGEDILANARRAAEDVSRNALVILPEEGQVLTHSYSATVKRALELAVKSGRRLQVWVTESSPGFEGKQLAKDLINDGVPVRLIADSAAVSAVPNVDAVLVGADSVLSDGSLVHKVGTKQIANAAIAAKVPFYVACEEMKFSTSHFLGESVEVSEIFDVTPPSHVSHFITEDALVETSQVEKVVKDLLREVYT
jgi:translation initiation factor 2B subunit (eIF-2B alpha/beta/delta family)/8-oxo-dGTP pyrophosphatase MutT (NUDIX family)